MCQNQAENQPKTLEDLILCYLKTAPSSTQQLLELLLAQQVEVLVRNPRLIHALLQRMQQKTLIAQEWQKTEIAPIRVYTITAEGERYLTLSSEARRAFSDAIFERLWRENKL